MDRWCSPYSRAAGRSSSNEMNTMMPATLAKIRPNATSFITGMRISQPISAPTGSARPERKE